MFAKNLLQKEGLPMRANSILRAAKINIFQLINAIDHLTRAGKYRPVF
jgi:hypothetical protein